MTLAVCAIIRNEAPYLREWIEFHRIVGVERFFLYEHGSNDDWRSILGAYVAAGIVEVQVATWPTTPLCQVQAYQHFIRIHSGENMLVAFIGCDEFLFSPCFETIQAGLAQLPVDVWGAVGVNRMCFGSSGQENKTEGLVIERFTFRPADCFRLNREIKSIVRMDRVESANSGAYGFCVNGGIFSASGEQLDGAITTRPVHNLLRVNYYGTKSRQEYFLRVASWRSDTPVPRDPAEFERYQAAEVEDRTIWRFLPRLKDRLRLNLVASQLARPDHTAADVRDRLNNSFAPGGILLRSENSEAWQGNNSNPVKERPNDSELNGLTSTENQKKEQHLPQTSLIMSSAGGHSETVRLASETTVRNRATNSRRAYRQTTTFIVSAYDRPHHLRVCLASLLLQQKPCIVVVTDNSPDQENKIVCEEFGCLYMHTRAPQCYHSAEMAVTAYQDTDWYCFPSDDSYYVPTFLETMRTTAERNSLDLVYCDCLYDQRFWGDRYEVLRTTPRLCGIDKTSFLVKREWMIDWPGKGPGPTASDGLLIEELVRRGIRHGKAPGVMVVHN
jgi:hypothetical protein